MRFYQGVIKFLKVGDSKAWDGGEMFRDKSTPAMKRFLTTAKKWYSTDAVRSTAFFPVACQHSFWPVKAKVVPAHTVS
jgi:hypothetical protein